jgi:putative nucleotidyltransferase with HDIG domain
VAQDEVRARIVRTLSAPTYDPPFLSPVAVHVMALSRRPDVQLGYLVKVLEREPMLAARVLSLAQSAAFTGRAPVLTLHDAAVRLGLTLLGDVVLQAALHAGVFRIGGYEGPMDRLVRHSTATAHLARLVCRRTAVDAEYAFLCGLLHDVGFAAGLLALLEDPAIRALGFAAVAPALDEFHQEAAGIVARLWELPEEICAFIDSHHGLGLRGEPSPLHAAVVVAEQLAWEAGCGLAPPPPDASPLALTMPEPPAGALDANGAALVEDACALLALDDVALCATRVQAFQLVASLFGEAGADAGPGAPQGPGRRPLG